ncbi:AMP-binding protein [Nocardia aurantiaca]|uniref:AMP-binding protein n=1 Tax=Nocardia aurantiaca TaxID=2675850 RepID=A0A6I3L758_9NOCA|nr:AMP-binding protein [Nocardia aurantiaca]MTE15659.1 AMP-binding protein [Nocardia aurantiaca]
MTSLAGPSTEFGDSASESAAAVGRLLHRLARLPAVADRYLPLLDVESIDTTALPLLSKSDLESVFPALLQQHRESDAGAYLYASGGTTSAPKLSLIPTDMFVPDILPHWRPLDRRDVIANIYSPGRLWSSHNFFNAVAAASGAVCLAFGALDDDEVPRWLDFFEHRGVTALDGTASQIARLLEASVRAGHRPPRFLRKLLWTGEPYDEHTDRLVCELLPDAGRYGVYGSTETWVIGHNGPACDATVFHTLPYQRIELVDGEIVVTNTHPQTINPLLRYRIGDLGEFVECRCGAATPGLRVLGRADTQIKFRSILLTVEELLGTAATVAGVRRSQAVLLDHGAAHERLVLKVVADDGVPDDFAENLRTRILGEIYRLNSAIAPDLSAFTVEVVAQLELNPRTLKTPSLVTRATI